VDSRTDTAEKLFQMSFLFHNKMMRPVLQNSKSSLSPLQVHVLNTLKDNGTATMTLVANEIKMSKQQTTRVVDQLVSQGFVRRDFEEQDRRIIKISLTAAGEAELENIKEEAIEHMVAKIEMFDERKVAELNDTADRLSRLLRELP
jgi:DNA-binding MarR family transcriptional regulator